MNRLEPGTMCADCGCCEAVALVLKEPLCRSCRMGFPLCEKKRAAGESPAAKPEPLTEKSFFPNGAQEVWRTPRRAAPVAEEASPEAKPAPEKVQQRHRLAAEVIAGIKSEPASVTNLAVARKYGVSDMTVIKHRGRRQDLMAQNAAGRPKRMGQGIKTPEEVRAAIAAEDLGVRTEDVAHKYGVSYPVANTIRRKAGRVVALEARKRRRDAKTLTPAANGEFQPKPMEADMEDAIEEPTLVPETEPAAEQATVTLQFSPEQLDAIWGKLSTDVKGVAIQGVLQAWV